MKITIGALVLCKVLISDPPSTAVNNPNSNLNAPTSVEYQEPKTAEVRQNNSALNNISKQPVIKEGNVVYTMLEGEVVNVYKHSYYAPVGKTGKFEKKEEEDLVIKSKEIDHLVISSRACGILSDYMYDEKSYKEQQKIKNKAKQKPAKEEVIVIRSDSIPEGYEKVQLGAEVEEAIKKEYVNDVKKEELNANETFLKNLEHDQDRFVKEQKTKEGLVNTEESIIDESLVKKEESKDQKEEVAKEEAPKPAKQEKSSKELFASWEEERKSQLEAERQKELALKLEEEKKVKNSKPIVKNEVREVTPPSRHNSSEDKSIIKDAFKIITTE